MRFRASSKVCPQRFGVLPGSWSHHRGLQTEAKAFDLYLHHVKKQTNRVAHILARVSYLVDCYNVFESPPDVLLETLYSEYPI